MLYFSCSVMISPHPHALFRLNPNPKYDLPHDCSIFLLARKRRSQVSIYRYKILASADKYHNTAGHRRFPEPDPTRPKIPFFYLKRNIVTAVTHFLIRKNVCVRCCTSSRISSDVSRPRPMHLPSSGPHSRPALSPVSERRRSFLRKMYTAKESACDFGARSSAATSRIVVSLTRDTAALFISMPRIRITAGKVSLRGSIAQAHPRKWHQASPVLRK